MVPSTHSHGARFEPCSAARLSKILFALFALSFGTAASVRADAAPAGVRLYALDCGGINFSDMSLFADTGEYDGRAAKLVDPCFLIRHPKGDLLWDTGIKEELASTNGGAVAPGIQVFFDKPLAKQLSELGLSVSDIDFLAFSHMHFDHTGNANVFTEATWILNQRELAWATSPEALASGNVDPSTFSAYQQLATQQIDGDYDVFGDGSVRILRSPGHTPGHQILMLSLSRAGKVILGGDLFHTKENQREGRVPLFNTDRADTLASFDRAIRLVRAKRARFVVQHAPEDFAALPRFPRYLD
ncbi:MAG: metallo-beta-lactamase superfamily protein [Myxococcaceae bacterium]|nr:metallo-beta-lactamase superfamily protein [Myxococcaceae bacterium]